MVRKNIQPVETLTMGLDEFDVDKITRASEFMKQGNAAAIEAIGLLENYCG